MLKARQRTQARFESFLQDAVAEERCDKQFLSYKCFVWFLLFMWVIILSFMLVRPAQ